VSKASLSAEAQFNLANSLAERGKLDEAATAYQQAIALQPNHGHAYINLGMMLRKLGHLEAAVQSYRRGIEITSDSAHAYFSLGNVLVDMEQLSEAIKCFEAAVRLDPLAEKFHFMLASTLAKQGNLEDAICAYNQVLQLHPHDADAYFNLGGIFRQQGDLEASASSFRRILEINPNDAQASFNLGNVLEGQGEYQRAVLAYEDAIALNPKYARAYAGLGSASMQMRQLDQAIAAYRTALGLNSDLADTWCNLGDALAQKGEYTEAINSLQTALKIKPEFAGAYCNLANTTFLMGNLDVAWNYCLQALALEPEFPEAHNNLGLILSAQNRVEEAIASYEKALAVKPNHINALWNRALALLKLGNFAQGWVEYEWRWQSDFMSPPDFAQPIWDGSSLIGKTILLVAEQGLGDMMQFIRYVPLVAQSGGRIIVQCPASLIRLFATCSLISQLVEFESELPEFDVYAHFMSLPRILGTTLETIPTTIPYLKPPESYPQLPPVARSTQLKVGIAWASGYKDETRILLKDYKKRSCPLAYFVELLQIPGVSLYSLQVGKDVADLYDYLSDTSGSLIVDLGGGTHPGGNRIHDFADTAAIALQLDLVISVDTSIVHLAGALACPTWVLLPFNADWRWLLGRNDSPWYPSMRLFRQPQSGDWASVFREVAIALAAIS
jgi:tetratricopeptide (TPR) repeat protein